MPIYIQNSNGKEWELEDLLIFLDDNCGCCSTELFIDKLTNEILNCKQILDSSGPETIEGTIEITGPRGGFYGANLIPTVTNCGNAIYYAFIVDSITQLVIDAGIKSSDINDLSPLAGLSRDNEVYFVGSCGIDLPMLVLTDPVSALDGGWVLLDNKIV